MNTRCFQTRCIRLPASICLLLTLAFPLVTSWFAQGAAFAPAGTGFRFAEVNDKSLGLWEGEKPVFVYNHGVLSKPGVPADLNRSSYVHPVYGLDGEVLTDDFPKDHLHHRGLFWAWPHVGIEGKEYDLWALKGIEQRFARWLVKEAGPGRAVLGVENGWYVGKQQVMQERVWLRVLPATESERVIDLSFEWVPVGKAITLAGAPGKSYGGLTLRFAPGTQTTITIPAGKTDKDLYMTNLPWADLSTLLAQEKKTSGAAIFVHPSHPDMPPQWLTRHYGVLCLGWPGVTPKTFPPGQPFRCMYRVWIHRGVPDVLTLQQAYRAFVPKEKGSVQKP